MIPLHTRYKAIVHYREFLQSIRKVAKIYNVSKSSVARWLKNENVHIRQQRKTKELMPSIQLFIEKHILDNPFTTLENLKYSFQKEFKTKRSTSSLFRDLKKQNISRKASTKKGIVKDCVMNSYDFENLHSTLSNIDCLSIDESSFNIYDNPRYGYSKKGKRIVRRIQYQGKRTISLLMAISKNEVVGFKIQDCPFNSKSFSEFILSLNCPPKTPIVLDNVAFHKSKIVKEAIANKGFITCYNLAYSPQLNPIELAFSVLKRSLRFKLPIEKNVDCMLLSKLLHTEIKEMKISNFDGFFKHATCECLNILRAKTI
jgi:transposase